MIPAVDSPRLMPTPGAVRARLRDYPVCDARRPSGAWCRRIAVSAVQLDPYGSIGHGFESRCPDHAEPDALRVCLGCRGENRGRDPWHCRSCLAGDPEREAIASGWDGSRWSVAP